MKIPQILSNKLKAFLTFFMSTVSIFVLFQCKSDRPKLEPVLDTKEVENDYVDIVTNVMDFEMTDSLASGWHTFRYKNLSTEPHFFLVEKYPEGKTIEDGKKEVIIPFQNGMNMIMADKAEEAGTEFAKLPEWYGEVKFCGGSGIISPGEASMTTLNLNPGYYVIECYMKMKGGVFHSSMGMVKELIVYDSGEEAGDPGIDPDVEISISSASGIEIPDSIQSGTTDFVVVFKDQIVHENFVGHDVNLAEINDTTDLNTLESWMNWALPDGLTGQAPEGVRFLGGVNDMSTGEKGYFKVNLEAGKKYVFVSEVPNTIQKNMLKVFTALE